MASSNHHQPAAVIQQQQSCSFDEQILLQRHYRQGPDGEPWDSDAADDDEEDERLLFTTSSTSSAFHDAEGTVGVLMVPSPPALRRFGSFGRDHRQRKREAALENDGAQHQSSSVVSVASGLMNCILGSGLLGLPLAMSEMGFGMMCFMMFLVVIMSSFSMNILVMSGRAVGQFRFALLARDRFGDAGFFVVSFFIFISCLGCMLPYLIIVGDTIPSALRSYTDVALLVDRRFAIICISVCIMPFLFFKNVGKLIVVAIICLVCIPVILIILIARGFAGPHYSQLEDHSSRFDFIGDNVFSGFGILTYAMVCNQVAFMSFLSLKVRSTKNWISATLLGHLGAGIFSLAFATIGFFTFGRSVYGNLLNNYPEDDLWINITRLLMTVNVLCSFPMQFYSARDTLHKIFGFETRVRQPTQIENVCVSGAMFFSVVAISLLVKDLGFVFALVGNFSSTSLTYILPPMLYMSTFFPSRWITYRQDGLKGLFEVRYCSPLSIFDRRDVQQEPLLRPSPHTLRGGRRGFEGARQGDIPLHFTIDFAVVAFFVFGVFMMVTGTSLTIKSAFH
eukprot:TRINITY_DN13274_c0_g1_i1.p1 TRINITY_DN13274_c0_g1~~TRINITY_DN13274_c0_g1_i1.p1  ORF type:complete len:564 (-),score=135.74 TRINITY_DN13274_c0_g1_i1:1000-2691(-)